MANSPVAAHTSSQLDWLKLIPDAQWQPYRRVLELAQARNLPFALGGGLAYSAYTERWRNTKDMDLYIRPADRAAMIEVLTESGLTDYFEREEYDRGWIYRGYLQGVIIDLIWQMANRRVQVADDWLVRGPDIEVGHLRVKLLAPEELLWTKLYVLQRDRSDWPDLLSLLYTQGAQLDWHHLIAQVGDDSRLLGSLVAAFVWLCPAQASRFPPWLWQQLGIAPPAAIAPDCERDRRRVALLDSRDWFCPAGDRK